MHIDHVSGTELGSEDTAVNKTNHFCTHGARIIQS